MLNLKRPKHKVTDILYPSGLDVSLDKELKNPAGGIQIGTRFSARCWATGSRVTCVTWRQGAEPGGESTRRHHGGEAHKNKKQNHTDGNSHGETYPWGEPMVPCKILNRARKCE